MKYPTELYLPEGIGLVPKRATKQDLFVTQPVGWRPRDSFGVFERGRSMFSSIFLPCFFNEVSKQRTERTSFTTVVTYEVPFPRQNKSSHLSGVEQNRLHIENGSLVSGRTLPIFGERVNQICPHLFLLPATPPQPTFPIPPLTLRITQQVPTNAFVRKGEAWESNADKTTTQIALFQSTDNEQRSEGPPLITHYIRACSCTRFLFNFPTLGCTLSPVTRSFSRNDTLCRRASTKHRTGRHSRARDLKSTPPRKIPNASTCKLDERIKQSRKQHPSYRPTYCCTLHGNTRSFINIDVRCRTPHNNELVLQLTAVAFDGKPHNRAPPNNPRR